MADIDEYNTRSECILNLTHLTDCDDDGYCNYCGEQDPARYFVLDQNVDVLYSTDSWGLAVTYLSNWETSEVKGAIFDTEENRIVKDNTGAND